MDMDIYTNCGNIELTRKVFDNISNKGVVAWTAIIAAYGLNSHAHHVSLQTFMHYLQQGVKFFTTQPPRPPDTLLLLCKNKITQGQLRS